MFLWLLLKGIVHQFQEQKRINQVGVKRGIETHSFLCFPVPAKLFAFPPIFAFFVWKSLKTKIKFYVTHYSDRQILIFLENFDLQCQHCYYVDTIICHYKPFTTVNIKGKLCCRQQRWTIFFWVKFYGSIEILCWSLHQQIKMLVCCFSFIETFFGVWHGHL